jgi:hypothetical protein
MKSELTRVQGSIDSQAESTAARIAEIERQRDTAISEAAYAKAKLAAHGGGTGSQVNSPQPDATRGASASPDIDRVNDISRRLATSLHSQKDLNAKLEGIYAELDSERRARTLAEETAEAAEKRISELDSYKQRNTAEVESLRAELHEAQRIAREEAANCAAAVAAHRLMEADKNELTAKHSRVMEDSKGHTTILQSLRDAVTASTEKADHLASKLNEERELRTNNEKQLVQLKIEHDQKASLVESLSKQLQDSQILAEKHAQEAKTHREAVLSGLGAVTNRSIDTDVHVDERIDIMSQQLESANLMSRQNKEAADNAAEKLRSAEERIAGLEAYQEQTSRENLTIRKQAQLAMKETQSLRAEKAEMQHHLERSMLDGNALEVQLKTLKNLLEERGINAADVRRSRILESPGSRYGTPDLNRIRELERQLDESLKAHEELRQTFEAREQDSTRDWEEKLQALTNDHQESNKYVRALEKYLTKMKAELQKSKNVQAELEKEVVLSRSPSGSSPRMLDAEGAKEWELERDRLRSEIAEMQEGVKTSVGALEGQISTLKVSLAQAEIDRDNLNKAKAEHESTIKAITASSRAELDALQRENKDLAARAADAEHKVQMFLDQFESSVDNYRRLSRLEQRQSRGLRQGGGPGGNNSADADSLYSTTTVDDEEEEDEEHEDTETETNSPVAATTSAKRQNRTSLALDTLTTELDALRSKWETTSRNYKLSEPFDFEKSPIVGSSASGGPSSTAPGVVGVGVATAPGMHPASSAGNPHTATAGGGGLARWAKDLETDTESLMSEESAEKLLVTPPRPAAVTSHPANAATTVTK